MIDESTFNRFKDAQQQARQHGLALIEVLDYRSLLWTEKRKHDIQVQTLDELYRRLSLQSPNKLLSFYLNRTEGSAADMLEAVKLWIETVTRNLADGTLEDL